ncbi:hypothetical protein PRIPAC_73752 [Pristionchus pacificus]|uniref:Uncharacterized protein n=1 Tax=Pristionchus pacificus TaxID=54126 RepID=A0A2A6C103_PRIPA|nr:hypothetical protein PRIPAC_73752 [Pristionchus pacificus]|eukprot:PDM71845.1 hypothetical protein PRIPAC_38252 [Pristionchus pacificus]
MADSSYGMRKNVKSSKPFREPDFNISLCGPIGFRKSGGRPDIESEKVGVFLGLKPDLARHSLTWPDSKEEIEQCRAMSGFGPPEPDNSPDFFTLNVGSPARLSAIVGPSDNFGPSRESESGNRLARPISHTLMCFTDCI